MYVFAHACRWLCRPMWEGLYTHTCVYLHRGLCRPMEGLVHSHVCVFAQACRWLHRPVRGGLYMYLCVSTGMQMVVKAHMGDLYMHTCVCVHTHQGQYVLSPEAAVS